MKSSNLISKYIMDSCVRGKSKKIYANKPNREVHKQLNDIKKKFLKISKRAEDVKDYWEQIEKTFIGAGTKVSNIKNFIIKNLDPVKVQRELVLEITELLDETEKKFSNQSGSKPIIKTINDWLKTNKKLLITYEKSLTKLAKIYVPIDLRPKTTRSSENTPTDLFIDKLKFDIKNYKKENKCKLSFDPNKRSFLMEKLPKGFKFVVIYTLQNVPKFDGSIYKNIYFILTQSVIAPQFKKVKTKKQIIGTMTKVEMTLALDKPTNALNLPKTYKIEGMEQLTPIFTFLGSKFNIGIWPFAIKVGKKTIKLNKKRVETLNKNNTLKLINHKQVVFSNNIIKIGLNKKKLVENTKFKDAIVKGKLTKDKVILNNLIVTLKTDISALLGKRRKIKMGEAFKDLHNINLVRITYTKQSVIFRFSMLPNEPDSDKKPQRKFKTAKEKKEELDNIKYRKQDLSELVPETDTFKKDLDMFDNDINDLLKDMQLG